MLYTKLVAHQLLIKHAPGAYVIVALDRSLSRWSDMIHKIGAFDPGAKFYLIRQYGEGQRFIRPLLVKELFALMGAQLSEIYTTTELADLVSRVPHRTMCRLLGSAYHLTAELAHWVASICSADRLIPRGTEEICFNSANKNNKFRCWGFVAEILEGLVRELFHVNVTSLAFLKGRRAPTLSVRYCDINFMFTCQGKSESLW